MELPLTSALWEAVERLQAARMLRRQAVRLVTFLEALRPGLTRIAQDGERAVIVESLLNEIAGIGAALRGEKGRLAKAMMFFTARQQSDKLAELHQNLLEITLVVLVSNQADVDQQMETFSNDAAEDLAMDAEEERREAVQDLEHDPAPEAHELAGLLSNMRDTTLHQAFSGSDSRVVRLFTTLARNTASERSAARADIEGRELDLSLGAVLGRGGLGEVLAAVWTPPGNRKPVPVAIKRVLVSGNLISVEAQQSLMREAEEWKRLKHRNLLELLGTSVLNNQLVLVMERCDMSLQDLIYNHPERKIEPPAFETLARGIARGLVYLHERYIIHRDVKPANILLSRDLGKVKLADFGLATVKREGSTYADTSSIKGTIAYMAPEVLKEPARWTAQVDVYAFAILLWEVLHRTQPWTSMAGQFSIVSAVSKGERPPFSEDLLCKPWYVDLIKACWAQSSQQRPRSREVLEQIERKCVNRRSTKVVKTLLDALKRTVLRADDSRDLATNKLVMLLATEEDSFDEHLAVLNKKIVSRRASQTQSVSEEVEERRARAWAAGAGSVLTDRIGNPSASEESKLGCIKALVSLWNAERGTALLAIPGFAPALTDFMETNSDNANAIVWGGSLVNSVAGSDQGCTTILEHGMLRAIVLAMEKNLRNREAVQVLLLVVARLASIKPGREAFVQLKGAPLLLCAMTMHLRDETVQKLGCSAIYQVGWASAANQRELAEVGAIEAILRVLRTCSTNAGSVEAAFNALFGLTPANKENQDLLLGSADAEVLSRTIVAFKDNASVLSRAFRAVSAITLHNKRSQALLFKQGIPSAILAGMKDHVGDAHVQESACLALWSFAGEENSYRLHLVEGRADVALLRAMDEHAASPEVQSVACAAIGSLALDKDCAYELHRLGLVEAVLRAMETHLKNAKVQEKGTGALNNFAIYRKLAIAVVKQGGALAVLRAMDEHPESADVQWVGCVAIKAFVTGGKAKLGDLGVRHKVQKALELHGDEPKVATAADDALTALKQGRFRWV